MSQPAQILPHGRVLRYAFAERLNHWLAAFSYIYLLLTGLAFWSPWCFWIAVMLGGGQTSTTLHPWIGLVFFIAVMRMYSLWAAQMRSTDAELLEGLGQVRLSELHRQGATLDHADAVSRQSAELGLLPHDLAALGIDSRERGVRRDEESAHRRELLPADVSLHLECPCRGRTRRGGRNGLSIELLRSRGYSAG